MIDGHSGWCKECERQKNARNRDKNKSRKVQAPDKKKCSTCGQYKSIKEFYKNRSTKDGYDYECKECEKKRKNENSSPVYKKCSQCHKIKLISDFYFDQNKKTHKRAICNSCHEIQASGFLLVNIDEIPQSKKCLSCEQIKPISSYRQSQFNKSIYSNYCKECQKQMHKNWYENNKQKALDYTRKYRDAHREYIRDRSKRYNHQHPWAVRASASNRRARIINATDGSITPQNIQKLYLAQNGLCAYCGCDLQQASKHLDHIVPLARGGDNTINNVQWTCPYCNMHKNMKTNEEWFNDLLKQTDDYSVRILRNVGIIEYVET